MSDSSDQASEQGRFAAREFIARYVRETGQAPPVEFAYEVGYLRGRSDAALAAIKMFNENNAEETKKVSEDNDDDSK